MINLPRRVLLWDLQENVRSLPVATLDLELAKTGSTNPLTLGRRIDGDGQKFDLARRDAAHRESSDRLRWRMRAPGLTRIGNGDQKTALGDQEASNRNGAPRFRHRHGPGVKRGQRLNRHGRMTGGGSDAGAASAGRT